MESAVRFALVGTVCLFSFSAVGQTNPQPATGAAAQPSTGAAGFRRPKPQFDFNNNAGWTEMFNGRDLSQWDGDKSIWKVKDGSIFAESTCVLPTGTVYIDWNGDKNVGDFDMKFETRTTGAVNGGVQYRSWIRGTPGKPLPPPPRPAPSTGGTLPGRSAVAGGPRLPRLPLGSPNPSYADKGGRASGPVVFAPTCGDEAGPGPDPKVAVDPYYLDGPQFDYDGKGGVAGNFYEQGGRGTIVSAGEVVIDEPETPPVVMSRIADADTAKSWWKPDEWNQLMIVARGHTYMQFLNGHLVSVFTDDEPTRYQPTGMIGFEIESTGTVEMKNLYIRKH
jgi:hypothetical protein